MIGRLFCIVWAHHWMHLYENGAAKAVFACRRCAKVRVMK